MMSSATIPPIADDATHTRLTAIKDSVDAISHLINAAQSRRLPKEDSQNQLELVRECLSQAHDLLQQLSDSTLEVDDTDRLNWDFHIATPPARPTGSVLVVLTSAPARTGPPNLDSAE